MSGPSFYKEVVPLDRDRHRGLKLRMDGRVAFAAGAHFVPVAAVEFYEAARDYTVVFAGSEDATPLAILGLRDGENLFVDADGRWAKGTYLPVFVRRYPFILTRVGQGPADFAVCLDQSFEGFSETEGTPLFDEQGNESELVSRVVRVLQDFLTETERTRRFVQRLRELELLTVQSMQVQDGAGRTFALRDFRIIDENKLKALDNEVLGELHRAGYLGCIYAHLVSLGNAARLPLRLPAGQTATHGGAADAASEVAASAGEGNRADAPA